MANFAPNDLVLRSYDEQIEYFTQLPWGSHYEDDKYWDDDELFDSFIIFYVYLFAHLNLPRPSRAQLEMAAFIADSEGVAPHRMVEAMRGLSKSLTAQAYSAWRFLRNKDEHILVMSASGTRAGNFTSFVQKIIKLLPITRHMTPRHNQERTSGSAFDVAGATDSDSPSMYAVGVENQIAGFRATLVIYDDIETKQNSYSAAMSDKIDHYAKEAHNLLMSGHDESITLCTPHSKESIYNRWIDEGTVALVIPSEYPKDISIYGDRLAKYIVERLKKFPSLEGTAVDERINEEFLARRKLKIGASEYMLQYMIDTTESDDLKHPLKLSDFIVMDVDIDEAPLKITYSSMPDNEIKIKHNGFKTDKVYKPASMSEAKEPYWEKVMTIDPSGRGKDETAYAIGFHLNGRIFVKDINGVDGGYDDDSMRQLLKIAKINGVTTIVIESNFGDGSYQAMIKRVMNDMKLSFDLAETRAVGQKEVRIINTIEPILNQHRLVLDKAMLDRDYLASKIYSFTYQITHLTRERQSLRHDDRIDALEMLCAYFIEKLDVDEDGYIQQSEEEEMMEIYDALTNDYPYASSHNYGEMY